MTRTARSSKPSSLPATPWAQLKAGYKPLKENTGPESNSEDDCEQPVASTVSDDHSSVVADGEAVDWDDTSLPRRKTSKKLQKIKKAVKRTASMVIEARRRSSTKLDQDLTLLVTHEAHNVSDEAEPSSGCGTKRPHPPGNPSSVEDKKQKRSEARRLRRQKSKLVCFNCRGRGHRVSDCPRAQGTGICFKCGSSSHSSKNCTASVPEGEFPYAECFVCGETGHLSRACPENPKGLYPNGGGCNLCGSVEHFKSNCPEKHRGKKRPLSTSTDKQPLLTKTPPHSGPKLVTF